MYAVLVAALPSATSSAAIVPRLGTLSLQIRDTELRGIAARVQIAPATWTERLRLGQLSDIQVMIPERGSSIDLAAGDYRLIVTRGPEWSIESSYLTIRGGERRVHRGLLAHEIELEGWQGADLHVHTENSHDARQHGGVDALDLRAEGIGIAVSTDHNHVSDFGPDIDSVPGAELTTWAPEIGHFNAFPLQKLPRWRGTSPRQLFEELARDRDVFVQINHPRLEDHISYFSLGGFTGRDFAHPEFSLDVDGLEVWNGYDIARLHHVERLLSEWRGLLTRGHRLTATGGSDCHGSARHLPGYPRTYVQAGSARELAPALKAGRAFVTNGPLLALRVSGKGPGEVAHARHDGTVDVELTVLAASFMSVERAELWAGERLVWSVRLPPAQDGSPQRFFGRIRVPVDGASTLHAVARGGRGLDVLLGRSDVAPFAFTNPVYLESTREAAHGGRDYAHVARAGRPTRSDRTEPQWP